MISKQTSGPRPLSRWSGGAVAVTTAAIVLASASPAAAHHGWDGFDTDRLVYIAGEVSSDGRWGEPHSYFDVALDDDLPVDTPELPIPDELQNPEDSIRVTSALSYSGPQEQLEVIIAPPAWSGRWGLGRALDVEERFQAVGYVNRTDDGLFRPVVFWYGDEQVPVNQVLGNTLPVRAPIPDPDGTTSTPSTTSTAPDPLETPAPTASQGDARAASDQEGTGTLGVWTAFGTAVAAAGVGGFLYLRRRTQQN
jgi:hypothetical protein